MTSPSSTDDMEHSLSPNRTLQILDLNSQLKRLAIKRTNLLRQLDVLAIEQAGLSRQWNGLQVTTHTLPTEILSRIFAFYGSPIRLGAVCTHWREVAWDTPLLWTTILCRMSQKDRSGTTKNCIHRLRLFLKNSHPVNVSLELNMDGWNIYKLADTIGEILSIVTQEARERLQSLRLKSFEIWDCRLVAAVYFHIYPTHFPNLEVLETGSDFHHPKYKINAPRIRQLILTDVPMLTWSFNQKFWNQLTVLRLNKTWVGICMELLRSCPPRLEVFECLNPKLSSRRYFALENATLPLHLTRFEWTGRLGAFEDDFWTHIRLPSVRYLTWNYQCSSLTDAYASVRYGFFQRLSSLEVLIMNQYVTIDEARNVWGYLDTLQELHLDACMIQKESQIDVMDALTLRHDPDHQNLLPNLRVLHIDILIGSGKSIVQMLRSRRDGPIPIDEHKPPGHQARSGQTEFRQLRAAVLQMEDMDWEPGDREDLNQLLAEDFRLDIYIADDRINYF